MRIVFASYALLGLGIIPLLPASVVHAQPLPSVASAGVADGAKTERISLRNITPDVMAWWLAPQNQKEPEGFRIARENANFGDSVPLYTPHTPQQNTGATALQEKGEPPIQLRSVQEANALEITGTPEQIRRAREIVQFLDKPLRQVELEFSIVRVREAKDALSLFNAKKWGPAEVKGLSVLSPTGNWAARLREMEKDGRASVTSRSRVTTFNNLTAMLMTTEKSTARMMWNGSERKVPVESSTGLVATPTINHDDTVTVVLKAGYFLSMQPGARRVPLTSTPQIVANVRDGDTITLADISVPTNAKEKRRIFEGRQLEGPPRDFITITSRIVRRHDEQRDGEPARDKQLPAN